MAMGMVGSNGAERWRWSRAKAMAAGPKAVLLSRHLVRLDRFRLIGNFFLVTGALLLTSWLGVTVSHAGEGGSGGAAMSDRDASGTVAATMEAVEAVRPQVGVGVQVDYNDNIYLTRNDRKSDLITRVNLSLIWGKVDPLWQVHLRYLPAHYFYSKHSEENQFVNAGQIDGSITLVRDLLFFEASDRYSRVDLTSRRQRSDVSSFVNQTDQNVLILHPYLKRAVTPTVSFQAGYTYNNTTYRSSDGTDREIHTIDAELTKTFSTEWEGSLLMDAMRNVATSGDVPDYERNRLGVGLHYRLGQNVDLVGRGGAVQFNSSPGGITNGFWAELVASYRYPATLLWAYRFTNDYGDSVAEGVYKATTHRLSVVYQRNLRVELAVFASDQDYTESRQEDTTVGGTMGLSYPITRSLTLTGDGGWQTQNLEPEGETVIRQTVGLGVRWVLSRYVEASIGYRHVDENSDVENNDVMNNVIFARCDAHF